MVQWINEFAAGWAEYFGWAVIQNSVFLAIIILLLRAMKDAPARIRYWIGMAGLVKLIIPPFLAAPFLKPSPVLLSSMTVIGIQPVMNVAEGASPHPQLSLSGILFVAWTALFLLFLLWPILASSRMKRLLSDAIPVDHRPIDGVRILKTDRINVPLAFGLFRESIYVPSMWDDWSDDTRRLILAHETAHIRRRDGLGRIFQILVQAIYFFHPMVWYISRKMNEYREMACDDLSTHNEKTLSVEYSRALVQIAERLVQSAVDCPSASALIRQKNELLNRVQYQMEDTMKTISKKRTAFILAGLLVLTVPLSWMKAKPAQEEPPQQKQSKQVEYETQLMSFPEGGIEAIQKNLVYPEAARKAGLEGRVVVQVHTTDKGFKDAEIIESSFEKGKDLGCHQAALDAVRSVRWGKVKGAKEAGGWVNVPFEFRLSPPPPPAVGKIFGKVTDTEGHVLPATNVTLLGTEMGAAADQSGNFYIINVPPGVYTLQASFIGFKSVLIHDVRVAVNESEEVNIQLELGGGNLTSEYPSEVDTSTAPPPPPIPDSVDTEILSITLYDAPPEPFDGFTAIQKKLVYPEIALKAGVEGRVVVYVQIDENGEVVRTRVVQSLGENNGCDEATIAAIKAVKWKPATQRDRPIKAWIAVPIDFKLKKKEDAKTK